MQGLQSWTSGCGAFREQLRARLLTKHVYATTVQTSFCAFTRASNAAANWRKLGRSSEADNHEADELLRIHPLPHSCKQAFSLAQLVNHCFAPPPSGGRGGGISRYSIAKLRARGDRNSLTPATATHECCHDRREPDLFAGQAAECATACACLPPRDKKEQPSIRRTTRPLIY